MDDLSHTWTGKSIAVIIGMEFVAGSNNKLRTKNKQV